MKNKKRILELEKNITSARDDYYNKNQTSVSDQVFDAWVDELKNLDSNNKLLNKVGALPVSEWKKENHKIVMGSLDKVNTPEEFSKWYSNGDLIITDKFDGISINCVYENGKLIQALTRGNGVIGENIFSNVIKMNGIQLNIDNFTGSLRGEILLSKANFINHFKENSSARNSASGTAKRFDGQKCEYLDVYFYEVVGNINFNSQEEKLVWIKDKKCLIPNYKVVKSSKEVSDYWRNYQDNIRGSLPYDIDGLVITYNKISTQENLGLSGSNPKYSVAFKFDNIMAESEIIDIEWVTGNSGRITPIAHITPTNLSGALIKKASIYNIAYINKLKLDIGAKVLITRANEIIPRIEQLITGTGKTISIIENCPSCNSKLIMSGENLLCTNHDLCQAQIIGKIKNWISALGIMNFGDVLVDKLVELKLIKTIDDLYKLSKDDLSSLDRMGEKSAENCLTSLHSKKELTLETFVGALSIPMNSESSLKLITSNGSNTLDKLFKLKLEDLVAIDGIGEIKANYFISGLNNNKQLINSLLDIGISIKEKVGGKLTGLSFCFSGALSMKRSELENLVTENGGTAKGSVGKTLNYLVVSADNLDGTKAKSAKKIGVKILSEEEFFNLLK